MTAAGSRETAVQTAYYAHRRPARIRPVDTAYVRRHEAELADEALLRTGERVCEWGAGLGRFSRLLADRGLDVTAIELSPDLAADPEWDHATAAGVRLRIGDVARILPRESVPFDAMLGFFVLHHLADPETYFRAGHEHLAPGGRMVFVEPNPWCPLYPLQIALARDMRWRAERGIYRLTGRRLRRAAAAAGFEHVRIRRYGATPPALYNALARTGRERSVERLLPPRLRPFQVISLWR